MVQRQLTPIATELEGIGHVLREGRLAVPPYQRPYSWESEQINDFWWDLRAAFGSPASQYFLGTVVLTSDETGATTIIDGQQRLATTTLLFTALRNEFLRRGDAERAQVIERDYILAYDLRAGGSIPRLELAEDDRPALLNAITHPNENAARETRISRALSFFEDKIGAETQNSGSHWAETLLGWVEFLDRRARIITVEVSDEADAFLIFETLNARGQDLTIADLLKNYLFGLARDDLDTVKSHWMGALTALEASTNEEGVTTFVRHLWSSIRGATRERDLYARMKAEITTSSTSVSFAATLESAAPKYAALLSSDHPFWVDNPSIAPHIDTLLRLGLEQNRPLLLAGFRRFQTDELALLLRAVINWSVRGLIVGGIGGGTAERAYSEAAVRVTDQEITTTAEVFEEVKEIVPADRDFTDALATRRIARTRIAKYLLVSLARAEAGEPLPGLVSEAEDAEYRLATLMPRRPDPTEWPAFVTDDIGQWPFYLGNQFVTRASSEVRVPSGNLLPDAEHLSDLSPEIISTRQRTLAEQASAVWPRSV